MSINVIPDDPLTRKLLAKVLAAMIKEDFEQARAGGNGSQPNPRGTASHDDVEDRCDVESTPTSNSGQVKKMHRSVRGISGDQTCANS